MSCCHPSKSDQEASSCPSASSTSTQWPSPPPPNPDATTDNTLYLEEILNRAMADAAATDTNYLSKNTHDTAHNTLDTITNDSNKTTDISPNAKASIQRAALLLASCEILLVVTGAGFSADSGLATYLDVADIEAYRKRGWRYRDLCRPFRTEGSAYHPPEDMEAGCNVQGEGCAVPPCEEGTMLASQPAMVIYPEEDDIRHPKYFYGFWGQCVNDYRKVGPHEGYDIIARWGRDKNVVRKRSRVGNRHSAETGANLNIGSVHGTEKEGEQESKVARDIRRITQRLEQRSREPSSSSATGTANNTHDDKSSSSQHNCEEPYHVSTQRAGAFFFFTSNVDAHSYDVFQSHEIRECHGNTEVWQCRNFACGTNDTIQGRCSSSSGRMPDGEEDGQKAWGRRLWRLPLNHVFEVDPVTMSAPPTKGKIGYASKAKKQSEFSSKKESLLFDISSDHGSGSTTKRQKSASDNIEPGYFLAENDGEDATGVLSYLQHQFSSVEKLSSGDEHDADDRIAAPAHIGDVRGKPRLLPLRSMFHPTKSFEPNYYLSLSPSENWPKCPRCNDLARPAVLMFYDLDWVNNSEQEKRWRHWYRSVLRLCKQRALSNDANVSGNGSPQLKAKVPSSPTPAPPKQPLKVLILEIGCGFNVPTCRMVSEDLVKNITHRGGDPILVRINLTHPEVDDEEIQDRFIGIEQRGLGVLKEMDKIYRQYLQKGSNE